MGDGWRVVGFIGAAADIAQHNPVHRAYSRQCHPRADWIELNCAMGGNLSSLAGSMSETVDFFDVGRLPLPGDNVAIATRTLAAGTMVVRDDARFALSHTILEGHRFACAPIPEGGKLLSWELPFGAALRDLEPGDYVCNEKMLVELRIRHLDFELPDEPNFRDDRAEYVLDESGFRSGVQVERHETPGMFQGFARWGGRGVGTRNFVVVLGTTSLTGSFARELAGRFRDARSEYPNVDGVVAIAHTEGGSVTRPNNFAIILRTLAGFMVHSNVAAVLAVDSGPGPIDNDVLKRFMEEGGYPLAGVIHGFFRHERSRRADLDRAEKIIRDWLPQADAFERSEQSIGHLKLAMQCGGSDAFSGVSGNPLSSEVAREILRHGGSANLAETTELIGAEACVLNNVRDLDTARAFLAQIKRFDDLARWHGQSAEGNPSGGNLYRGLYNIMVKSIGAAMKKHPEVRLDRVIEYGEPMDEPGCYFMDSAGNDLESIAGQVASGCNLIHFITGNGSITNFPFVPTVKIVTTTGRYHLLSREMDINAGSYLDGESMDRLGREAFDYSIEIASGLPSVGEQAGHSQVQIWREWRQTEDGRAEAINRAPQPTGEPLAIQESHPDSPALDASGYHFSAWKTENGMAMDRLGLIAPTSLCSGQIAAQIAEKLNVLPRVGPVTRFVALPHTEGCGTSRGYAEDLFVRTMIGYMGHRSVSLGLLLEHGCEKTHNDEFRSQLKARGIDERRFGWASIQADGGIDAVTEKVVDWFSRARAGAAKPEKIDVGLGDLRIGVASVGAVPLAVARAFEIAVRAIVKAGGSVVIAENASLLSDSTFFEPLLGGHGREDTPRISLAYGQALERNGLHIMDTPTRHLVETTTGLGACGADLLMVLGNEAPRVSHPMLPVLQCGCGRSDASSGDYDLVLPEDGADLEMADRVLQACVEAFRAVEMSKKNSTNLADFQMTRGWLGISL